MDIESPRKEGESSAQIQLIPSVSHFSIEIIFNYAKDSFRRVPELLLGEQESTNEVCHEVTK